MHFYVLRAQPLAREPNAAHNLLYGGLVDEVVEPELVRILELELVVVCEEAEEREGLEDEVGGVGLVDELRVLAGAHVGVGQDARTFIMEGKRSRWMRYVRRVVWKAPAVKASTTSIALCLSSTVTCKRFVPKPRA